MGLQDQVVLARLGRRGRAGRGPQGQSPARGAPDPAPRSGAALMIITANFGSARLRQQGCGCFGESDRRLGDSRRPGLWSRLRG